jgi:lipoate-protein ligase A
VKYIRNDNADPYYNLAFEEYVLRNFKDDDYVLIWQNDNTVVVGRHQNTLKEINRSKVEELGVNVIKRNTGGGAVYHDMGNVNFSYITDYDGGKEISYEKFLGPIIRALRKKGIHAVKTGRNDMEIEGRKFSGSAQTVIGGRFLHHGTLLFDSDLSVLSDVLNAPEEKIKSKSIESVRARVANIKEFLREDMDVEQFKALILETFFENEDFREVDLTQEQKAAVRELRDAKYKTWEWIYGKSPKANYRANRKFEGGQIEVEMEIEGGRIRECKIWGDFLALRGAEDIENALIGQKYMRDDIMERLKDIDLEMYFGNIKFKEIMECFA